MFHAAARKNPNVRPNAKAERMRTHPRNQAPPKKVSLATIGRELSVLRSILAFAVKANHLDKDNNPAEKIKIPKSRTIKRLLSEKQREHLFSQLSETIRAFFLFMAVTGWRYSKVAKLTWNDLAQFASVAYQDDPKTCETRGEEVPRFLPSSVWAIIEGHRSSQPGQRQKQDHRLRGGNAAKSQEEGQRRVLGNGPPRR